MMRLRFEGHWGFRNKGLEPDTRDPRGVSCLSDHLWLLLSSCQEWPDHVTPSAAVSFLLLGAQRTFASIVGAIRAPGAPRAAVAASENGVCDSW